jgi:hypothetical protein
MRRGACRKVAEKVRRLPQMTEDSKSSGPSPSMGRGRCSAPVSRLTTVRPKPSMRMHERPPRGPGVQRAQPHWCAALGLSCWWPASAARAATAISRRPPHPVRGPAVRRPLHHAGRPRGRRRMRLRTAPARPVPARLSPRGEGRRDRRQPLPPASIQPALGSPRRAPRTRTSCLRRPPCIRSDRLDGVVRRGVPLGNTEA